MKIELQRNFAINKINYQNKNNQKSVPVCNFCSDKFDFDNIDRIDFQKKNNRIIFKKPLSISQALAEILKSKDKRIMNRMIKYMHSSEELCNMYIDMVNCKELENIKVKQMIGMGAFALAFETTEGTVLKISSTNHFPNNRKPDFFDLPVLMQGKKGTTYYYIQEKAEQDNIKQIDLNNLLQTIKQKGYEIQDFHEMIKHDSEDYYIIRANQFGRGKDGKIYLLDPGCVKKVNKLTSKLKKSIFKDFFKD